MSRATLMLGVWYCMQKQIAAGPGTLDVVHAALNAVWSLHQHVPGRVRVEVEIAAGEIAANIVEHSGAGVLQMDIQVFCTQVRVEFTDRGRRAAVDPLTATMPEELAERGRGLAMARKAVRVLSYCRDAAGNHWRIESNAFPGDGSSCCGEYSEALLRQVVDDRDIAAAS